MTNNQIYILLRSQDSEELHIQGSPELVGRFMRAFFQREDGALVGFETVFPNGSLGGLPPMDMPELRKDYSDSVAPKSKPDFLTFYRFVSPSNQTEQVLTITYYYQKYEELGSLSLEEYDQAYTLLQRVPVEKPSNLKSSVRNVVDRTKFLRNLERGRFMLTLAGEEVVERLISEKQANS